MSADRNLLSLLVPMSLQSSSPSWMVTFTGGGLGKVGIHFESFGKPTYRQMSIETSFIITQNRNQSTRPLDCVHVLEYHTAKNTRGPHLQARNAHGRLTWISPHRRKRVRHKGDTLFGCIDIRLKTRFKKQGNNCHIGLCLPLGREWKFQCGREALQSAGPA